MNRRRLAFGLASLLAFAIAAVALLIGTGNLCVTSTARPEGDSARTVPARADAGDADGDGIDDQTDILEGALAYVATRPRYRSAYYAEGWPDDGCGVCTDVVARGLLAAGYDLKTLMAADIERDPEAYGIAEPDPAIDFRRVHNQQVFFERHAQALTTDVYDRDAWEPGDIAVLPEHVGIVSDRRDANGIPYLIHHEGSWQRAYEEDVLARRANEIVGHYRVTGGPRLPAS